MKKIMNYLKELFRGERSFWEVFLIWGLLFFILLFGIRMFNNLILILSIFVPFYLYLAFKTETKNKLEIIFKIFSIGLTLKSLGSTLFFIMLIFLSILLLKKIENPKIISISSFFIICFVAIMDIVIRYAKNVG